MSTSQKSRWRLRSSLFVSNSKILFFMRGALIPTFLTQSIMKNTFRCINLVFCHILMLDNNLLKVDGVKYLSFFRPFSVEDMKGVQA
jgi:hypothetical protein